MDQMGITSPFSMRSLYLLASKRVHRLTPYPDLVDADPQPGAVRREPLGQAEPLSVLLVLRPTRAVLATVDTDFVDDPRCRPR